MEVDFNDFGDYYLNPFGNMDDSSNQGAVPSDLNLLKVIHSDSQQTSLSECTVDKSPQASNEASSTFFSKSSGVKISRHLLQPNRFEKSLD
jgi:hypothetical protein